MGSLLEAGGDVDGIAGGVEVPFAGITRHDLAGVDAYAGGQSDAPLAEKLLVQLLETRAHLGSRSDRAQSIVFMGDWNAERGYDRIADELLDGAAVALEDGAHLDEVALHDTA